MFRDKQYLSTLVKIALPLIIQNLILSLLNMVDVLMIGQLGAAEVAAVGLANQILMLFTILMFGINSGAAIFMAQYWGKKDIPNMHKVVGISLKLNLIAAAIFGFISVFVPHWALGIYSNDPEVINLGSQYLRIMAIGYIPLSIVFAYAYVMRSAENPRPAMIASITAISLNTGLNYLLIFGNFGFPKLGVQGAAVATAIARFLECTILLVIVYRKKLPAAIPLRRLLYTDLGFLGKFFKTAAPVILNEMIWSFGFTTYMAVFARISTESIAAVSIAMTIDEIAFLFFSCVSNACAVMVGNQIGAGDEKRANLYGRRSLILTGAGGVLFGMVLILISGLIMQYYNVSELTRTLAQNVLMISSAAMCIRAMNLVVLIGILRSGGDTRFALVTEIISMWGVGVPLALLGGFVLGLEVHWVYLMVMTEELVKLIVGLFRFRSGKWLNNLVNKPEPELSAELA